MGEVVGGGGGPAMEGGRGGRGGEVVGNDGEQSCRSKRRAGRRGVGKLCRANNALVSMQSKVMLYDSGRRRGGLSRHCVDAKGPGSDTQ